jgi:hypothetical protein
LLASVSYWRNGGLARRQDRTAEKCGLSFRRLVPLMAATPLLILAGSLAWLLGY